MTQLFTINNGKTYYSKTNNEYKEVELASITASVVGGKPVFAYIAADGNTYDTLYCRANDLYVMAGNTNPVFVQTLGSSNEPIWYDEDGFYANAIALDGTRAQYRHDLGKSVTIKANPGFLADECGNFVGAKCAEDAAFFEEYKQINADGSVEEHKSKKSKVYLNDEELEFVKGKLSELFGYCNEHSIKLFYCYDTAHIYATHGKIEYNAFDNTANYSDLSLSQIVGNNDCLYDGCGGDYGIIIE